MAKITSSLAVSLILLALGLGVVPARALATRAFVSGKGADGGACPITAPCRTFAYAVTQTAPHGEIAVLDTAGYGAVTITQSISIVNPGGVEAGIAVALGGAAITINAGATDIVALRGLIIEGGQNGLNGIVLNTGGNLEIESCSVRDFTQNAILIQPTGTTVFRIANTIVADNGNDGILVLPQGTGTAQGVIDHVAAHNNFNNGIVAGGTASTSTTAITVTISNSVVSHNTGGAIGAGIVSSSAAGNVPVTVTASNTIASNNTIGLYAGTSGTIQISQTVVTANATGIQIGGSPIGVVNTFGDNDINLNTTPISGGSLTPVAPQ